MLFSNLFKRSKANKTTIVGPKNGPRHFIVPQTDFLGHTTKFKVVDPTEQAIKEFIDTYHIEGIAPDYMCRKTELEYDRSTGKACVNILTADGIVSFTNKTYLEKEHGNG